MGSPEKWSALTASVSATDSVTQCEDAVAEAALIEQLQLQAHTIREKPLPGVYDRGADIHLKLVNKTSTVLVIASSNEAQHILI